MLLKREFCFCARSLCLSLLILIQLSHYIFIKTINLRQVVLSAAFGYPATCQIPPPCGPCHPIHIHTHILSVRSVCIHMCAFFFLHTQTHSQFHCAMFQTNWMHGHTHKCRHNIVLGMEKVFPEVFSWLTIQDKTMLGYYFSVLVLEQQKPTQEQTPCMVYHYHISYWLILDFFFNFFFNLMTLLNVSFSKS